MSSSPKFFAAAVLLLASSAFAQTAAYQGIGYANFGKQDYAKAAEALHPDWQTWLNSGSKQSALREDAGADETRTRHDSTSQYLGAWPSSHRSSSSNEASAASYV